LTHWVSSGVGAADIAAAQRTTTVDNGSMEDLRIVQCTARTRAGGNDVPG
jgi:hypothetical protein